MKFLNYILLFFCLTLIVPTFAQKKNKRGGTRMFVPGKSRSDYFGDRKAPKKIMKNKTDKVRPFGFQAQLGATTTLVNPDSKNFTGNITPTGGRFEINPKTRYGIIGEIGFVHMNMRSTTARHKIIDYIDYGIGFKLFRGAENITIEQGANKDVTTSSFSLGDLSARFGVHKLQYLTKKKNIFIDHSLGINFDYQITKKSNYSEPTISFEQHYSDVKFLMLHYDVGLGFRLAKGRYLTVGVQAPFVEFLDKPAGNPSFSWFSSKYYPFLIRIKYIHLFPAKKSGQACWLGDEDQRKLNEQFLQGQ